MKAEHLRLLVELSDRPTATVRTRLIAIRRLCRVLAQELDVIRAERRALRRQAGRLRPFLPFTKLAVADLERQAASHRYDAMNDLCQALASFGRLLVLGRKEIAGALGFDGLCDLLNVNPVQRVALRGEGLSGCWRLSSSRPWRTAPSIRASPGRTARCSTPATTPSWSSSARTPPMRAVRPWRRRRSCAW
ncbi:hypothetical protein ACFSHR_13910 [Azotobacter chroococcum]